MDKADLTTLGHDLLKGEKALEVNRSEAQTKYIMLKIYVIYVEVLISALVVSFVPFFVR
jgi:hypothetical protein